MRRGFNVVNLSLGGAGCDGIAARLPLGRFMRDLAGLAAKSTTKSPPATSRRPATTAPTSSTSPPRGATQPTIERAADAVDLALGGGAPTVAGNQIRQIQAFLQRADDRRRIVDRRRPRPVLQLRHVGERHRRRRQRGEPYPSKTGWASWSGTSFATPRVSAVVAGGANPGDVDIVRAVGAC